MSSDLIWRLGGREGGREGGAPHWTDWTSLSLPSLYEEDSVVTWDTDWDSTGHLGWRPDYDWVSGTCLCCTTNCTVPGGRWEGGGAGGGGGTNTPPGCTHWTVDRAHTGYVLTWRNLVLRRKLLALTARSLYQFVYWSSIFSLLI